MTVRRAFQFSLLFATMTLVALGGAFSLAEEASIPDRRAKLADTYRKGNFKDALAGLKELVVDSNNDPRQVSGDLQMAISSMQRLGLTHEADALMEAAVKAHPKNWRLLQSVAGHYMTLRHNGFLIAGDYYRGRPRRGGGKVVNTLERDRVRALQLMQQAEPLAVVDDDKKAVASFYMNLSRYLLYNRGYREAWRLQYLSDLAELPDREEGWPYFRNFNGTSVDAEGNPVFHHKPDSWKAATTDGERWRWCLAQAMEMDPGQKNNVLLNQAQFYQQQYGVQTMSYYGQFFGRMRVEDERKDESGTYALHTLEEDETIARLATGAKRFELPDEFNHIKIFQQIMAEPQTGHGETAANALCQIFEDRRQYPKAATYWRQNIDKFGPGNRGWKPKRLDQIVNNWGRFEGIGVQPAGEGATVEFRFRNGKQLQLTAQSINVGKLLADVKDYLKKDPGRIDWNKVNIGNIGYRIVNRNETQYVEDKVADWKLDLEPRENHFDRRITVTTPLQKPGAYLLTGKMDDGNTSKVIIWVSDTAIVNKRLSGKNYYFVADAVTGKPISGANVEFFGYRQQRIAGNKYQVITTNFAEKADEEGQVVPAAADLKRNFQWLVVARDKEARFAYLGFQGFWSSNYYDPQYNAAKIFSITDRPVYRPNQKVKYKFWIRHAQYDKEDVSQFANKSVPLELYSPKGDKLFSKSVKTDEYGGIEGEWEIPSDAMLGQYRFSVRAETLLLRRVIARGGGTFRVEEYKKPEFEVSIEAPKEPVMLGEKIKAKIQAKYYFGSPVTSGKVKYKITRTKYNQDWYPVAEWDWFYGPGYWWFAYDYDWYPGFRKWAGCVRPSPWWWWRGSWTPPEVVSEQEVEIGPDGTVEVEIDTAFAKEMHGNDDHQYSISAEVRDQSRRTIVGTGNVLVARKPFKIFSWVDRGYYRVGDTIGANFKAQTLDSQPVEGKGILTLLKITYNDKMQPVEIPVRRWDVDTNTQGMANVQMRASAKGQYRLNYKLTDKKDHTIEGGYLFTIMGEGFDGKDYRFNNVELVPDQPEYQAGDTVKLQINTDRPDSTVLLFVRPTNGTYLKPKVIHMRGKSVVEEIEVTKRDMPNMFVEAVTISGGKVYSEAKELVVPPESRVLDVAVTPSNTEYKPGEKATVEVKLTDETGEPFVGSTVVSIYDKSVEYISGGSNVGDIREFYWKWRRQHHPHMQTSLARSFRNMNLPNQVGMAFLGRFGSTVADDLDAMKDEQVTVLQSRRGGINRDGGGTFGGGGLAGGDAFAGQAQLAQDSAAPDSSAPFTIATGVGMNKRKSNSVAAPGGAAPLVQPTVRSNFADTALWVGSLTTDKTGLAKVELDMPENLTTWKVKVWAMGHGTKVGAGETEVVTRKNLIVRLQAPRFFVQKDEVVLSANVHNYLKEDKEVTVSLEMPGGILSATDELTRKVMVKAGGEKRVDWRVKVVEEGQAVVRMKALSDEESDAMEMSFPSYVHGMLKTEAWAGTVTPDGNSDKVTIHVPSERRINQSVLEIRYSPSLAGAMVDALPYLVDYPYGCTEQTLNRFLPTVVTQHTLQAMKLDLKAIQEKRSNLNAQEIGVDEERAKQWKRFKRNPVFDEDEVERMVKDGLKKLTNMQNGDGGWGWFSGWRERSWPHTTAVVVHGLQVAQSNDVALVPGMLDRGIAWLERYQAEQVQKIKNAPNQVRPWKSKADNLDAMIYMILIDAGKKNDEMKEFLYRDRVDLAVYSKAMFGIALEKQLPAEDEKLAMILKNLEQYQVVDDENDTAYLKLPAENNWWSWYGSETEANAYYLKLLARVAPRAKVAPGLVKYLLNNRKHATYWSSTRDTAVVVEAFAEYLKETGELDPEMTVQVLVDGKVKQEVEINRDNIFSFNNKFVLTGDAVEDGSHEIEIRRLGKGPVYFNVYLTNFTLEDDIKKTGLEVKVQRKYYKLKRVDKAIKVEGARGQALDQKVEKYERIPLENLATVTSGDLVEIELEIDSKNDYEYLLFEDMKPAGFETVDVRSGYTNDGMGAYMEVRDNRVAFFVRALARGKHSVSYRMRAEIPGKFSALPTRASAMYAPELKANSDELKLNVKDDESLVKAED